MKNPFAHLFKKESDEQKLIRAWTKAVLDGEKLLITKVKADKEQAIAAIKMFKAMYVLEDHAGNEYTEERLMELPHKDLVELLEHCVEELKKDAGET